MFLILLKEENKEMFLKVCVYAAISNDVFAEEEKLMLSAYCREMNIEEHVPVVNGKFEDLVSELAANTDSKEKNIIILETLALIRSDGIYDAKEQEFMKTLTAGLGLPLYKLNDFTLCLDAYDDVTKQILEVLED